MKNKKDRIKKAVVIGGGTGAATILRGLKNYPLKLSAIVTTADNGGSSGKLRREFNLVPPGDVRQCFVALNEDKNPILSYFNLRFGQGSLKGHNLGNLFFLLLWQKLGDFQKAIDQAQRIFGSPHEIIPMTKVPTNFIARFASGKKESGVVEIHHFSGLKTQLKRLELLPKNVKINPKAKVAISQADFIIVAPGNLLLSLTPIFLVKGVKQAFLKSRAKKIYVVNLMNQKRLTDGFGLADYLAYFEKLLGQDIFDFILYNSKMIGKKLLAKLAFDAEKIRDAKPIDDRRFIGGDFLDLAIPKLSPHDPMKRPLVRHHPGKIGRQIFKLM